MHENFSHDAPLAVDEAHLADGQDPDAQVTLRLHMPREGFDLVALHEGAMPAAGDELALDTTFARAHRLGVGDTVTVAGLGYRICGIVTLPDYMALFQTNSGIVMNTLTFGVGTLTAEGWARLTSPDAGPGVSTAFTYSFFLDPALAADTTARTGLDGSALTDGDGTLTAGERRDVETDAAGRLIAAGARVGSLIDSGDNLAINYGTDDVSHDSFFITWLIVVLIVVVAFIVVVITSAAIEAESSVIGTLLASGWRSGELLRHYLALPALVGATACLAGNALGHTALVAPMRHIYYDMYSLPPYTASFSVRALLLTTVLPLGLLIGITALGLTRALRRTPLQFLRHEHNRRGHRAVHLPARLPFRIRFRLRLLLQARAAFATLFVGIVLSSFLLTAGLAFLPVVDNYTEDTIANLPAAYAYTLTAPVEPTSTDPAAAQAERLTTTVLQVERRWDAGPMDVQLLGVDEDSSHLDGLDVSGGRVVVGAGLLDKTDVEVGEVLTLTDEYTRQEHRLTIAGTWGNSTDVRVYLSRETLNGMLGLDAGSFNGYLSDTALELPGGSVASTTTEQDVRTAADQISTSLSAVLRMATFLAILVFLIVVHLLTKTVIDRGARTISLLKVLGHHDGEISAVYVRTVTLTVAASLLLSPALTLSALKWGAARVFIGYDANFVLTVPAAMVAEEIAIAFGIYLLVAGLHLLHVRRIPLGEALRVQE
ncbi:ABC transporter permease [Propionibacterium australiense]|uniref:ABC transporter permease n=1 Tax=Propionibacterium australiense TaxID=119981 RepID=UPI0011C44B20|nr:ABC transporter permease [Propionibacterium australiense]